MAEPRASDPVAAVDVGTQSTRLLVTNGGGDLERIATVTHLGRGVAKGGNLDPEGVENTLATLRRYRELANGHGVGVGRARAITTAVVRNAADPERFLRDASEALGFPLELVSGEEEGRLAFAGATATLRAAGHPAPAPYVTIDLGGGSTEFAVGTAACEDVISASFGATSLTEAYVASDPPRPEELLAALSIVEAHLDEVGRAVPALGEASTFIGLGGTFTTVAAVELGMADYDRRAINGFTLTKAAAEDVYRTLVTERLADRLHNPGLPASRGQTIVGGACAVVAIMRYFGRESMLISDCDLLDGMAADLLAGG